MTTTKLAKQAAVVKAAAHRLLAAIDAEAKAINRMLGAETPDLHAAMIVWLSSTMGMASMRLAAQQAVPLSRVREMAENGDTLGRVIGDEFIERAKLAEVVDSVSAPSRHRGMIAAFVAKLDAAFAKMSPLEIAMQVGIPRPLMMELGAPTAEDECACDDCHARRALSKTPPVVIDDTDRKRAPANDTPINTIKDFSIN